MGKTKSKAEIVPALAARARFGQILRRVKENRERFVVERRGEPQAVIMGMEEYLAKFVESPSAFSDIRRAAKAAGRDTMSLREINREIKAVRDARRRATR